MQQEMFLLMSHVFFKLFKPVFANILFNRMISVFFTCKKCADMLLCVIGYKYSYTSSVIFLFKLFEAFDSIYFVKTGISLLCFKTSSK